MSPKLQLHHVGYFVKEIPPAAEAQVARFGYQVITPVIHDPIQTAHVQFLRLPGDQTYLEFVAPDGAQSKLHGAHKRPGVLNHLCYTAPTLEDTVAYLEEQGMRLISELSPAVAFHQRRICWLLGGDNVPIELVERGSDADLCFPGV